MYYAYRWYLAIAIAFSVILIFFWLDLLPKYQALSKHGAKLVRNKEEFLAMKKQAPDFPFDKAKNFSIVESSKSLLQLAQRNNVKVTSLLKKHANWRMDVLVETTVFPMFLAELIKHGFLIQEFEISSYADKLKLQLKVMQADQALLISKSPLTNLTNNPFCSTEEFFQENPLQTLSLGDFRLIGFLQKAQHRVAILKLNDQFITTAKVGDVIGIEEAVVILINTTFLQLRLPSGELYRIEKMRKNLCENGC